MQQSPAILLAGGLLSRLLPYVWFTLAMVAVSYGFERFGGLPGLWNHKALELPLLLYLYFLLRQLLGDRPHAKWLAAVPPALGYILFDGYFLMLGRVFRLTELDELPELLDILPLKISIPIIAAVLIPIGYVISRMRIPNRNRSIAAAVPLAAILTSVNLAPNNYLQVFRALTPGEIPWSDFESVRANGRFSMILYQEAKRRAALKDLAEYEDDPEYQSAFNDTLATLKKTLGRRNLHVIVMEGFLDPAQLSRIKYSQDPVTPEFRKFLADGKGDLAISPVYGGYTAQAEFEVLCGVPAKQTFGTIEFNTFTGAPVHCMPEALRQAGYQTLATHGFKPDFFNSAVALRAVGFDEVYFAKEYAPKEKSYFSTGDVKVEEFMFDTLLFDQNLSFLQEKMAQQPKRPLFNYLLTIYGHFPFRIDETLRPRFIQADGPRADNQFSIVVNQAHYRSVAMAEYLKKLTALDPEGLILMVSDHVPPMTSGISAYDDMGYLAGAENAVFHTLLTVIDHGKPRRVGTLHQHQLPTLLYSLLSDGAYCDAGNLCRVPSDDELKQRYLRVMAHAIAEPQ